MTDFSDNGTLDDLILQTGESVASGNCFFFNYYFS
jgi:hypothetical protein